jgi:hypothetical protein
MLKIYRGAGITMFVIIPFLLPLASAHIAAFAKGMYCQNGLVGQENMNNNLPVNPLYQLSKEDWWFQHDRGCDQAPPAKVRVHGQIYSPK